MGANRGAGSASYACHALDSNVSGKSSMRTLRQSRPEYYNAGGQEMEIEAPPRRVASVWRRRQAKTLARISHQADLGSQIMSANSTCVLHRAGLLYEQPALFGSWPTLALHLDRSFLRHSYSYASADDRPICFARATQDSDKIAGSDFQQRSVATLAPQGRRAGCPQ